MKIKLLAAIVVIVGLAADPASIYAAEGDTPVQGVALNVAALILSALIVFRLRRIRPRSWIEQKNANRAVLLNALLSGVVLIISVALILYLDLGAKVSIG